MARRLDPTTADGHRIPGLYERLRDKELAAAAKPDPRVCVHLDPGPQRDAAIEENLRTQQRQDRCVLDVGALDAYEPVTVPRWYLGGHSFPEARDWPEYRDPNLTHYVVTPDDNLSPGATQYR
jgi:hypothetical protein